MAILKNAIEALDPVPNQKTELTLALSLISELAESKVTSFENEVQTSYRTAGTVENRTAPITLIIADHAEYRAYISKDAGKIATEVSSAIKKFVSGSSTEIIDGIAGLVTTGLEAILGAGEGKQQEMRSYYITAQAKALVRYDIYAWKRDIEATGITSQIESCMAIYASKASVNVQELDLNTFLLAYEDQLTKMDFGPKEALAYINAAEELYLKLKGESNGNNNLSFGYHTELLKSPQRPGHITYFPKIE